MLIAKAETRIGILSNFVCTRVRRKSVYSNICQGYTKPKRKKIEHGRRKGKMSSSENDTKKAGFWESLASADYEVTPAAEH
jgi:hypothetical protein